MTQTTYYEFNKPEGTDLVNPLVDTNPNWDKLDADLHEFNERSIANCTEVVTLGVHAISRLDTTAKFLKWIATANFTAGETFTVDGLAVAASTPAGSPLATGAYVTGSVVLACLNADNTAMTIYVSGTTVASDAERLGGQLPAYYATQSDMSNAQTDITNLQNKMGNTSIVGIGDGTATGAISAINEDLSDLTGNELNAGVNLWNTSSVNKFTAPSDGYIYTNTNVSQGTPYVYISYTIEGGAIPLDLQTFAGGTSASGRNAVFIKKGMKVYVTSSPSYAGANAIISFYGLT